MRTLNSGWGCMQPHPTTIWVVSVVSTFATVYIIWTVCERNPNSVKRTLACQLHRPQGKNKIKFLWQCYGYVHNKIHIHTTVVSECDLCWRDPVLAFSSSSSSSSSSCITAMVVVTDGSAGGAREWLWWSPFSITVVSFAIVTLFWIWYASDKRWIIKGNSNKSVSIPSGQTSTLFSIS